MKKHIITLFTLITIATVIGCTSTKSTVKTSSLPIQNVTFEKDIKPITENFCSGGYCHHGSPSYWSTYANIKKIVDNGELHEEVIKKKTMPMGIKLPKKEYNLIKIWLETGAKK